MHTETQNPQVPEGKTNTNRLAHEKSPYLLQHQSNPVNWYPWGDEAFIQAKTQNKPIFLSIGYSTCHWCHVMAHESFEDPDVASIMNRSFISIKVDREERPDVDHVYMTVCQLMTQSGGWPLTIIMNPNKEPFFGGTYLPKDSRFGRIGMMQLLPAIEKNWRENRGELDAVSSRVIAGLQQVENGMKPAVVDEESLGMGFEQLAGSFDPEHGGFGRGMKFPTPHQLLFLLRYWHRTGDDSALAMSVKTLRKMARGGIFDHVGFGFHRYSTDPTWLRPHFEKMLYDQALLLLAYTEAFEATGEKDFEITARQIAEYVLRDLRGREGGFYSAEDADSEGEEGKFYIWREEEIRRHLSPKTADIFLETYNVETEGNYEDESTGTRTGHNILHLTEPVSALSEGAHMTENQFETTLEDAKKILLEAREKRIRPLLDDKILTDWNGLMIGALAVAGRVFREPKYKEAAEGATRFIRTHLTDENGELLHRYRDGEAAISGQLDDYAFQIFGLIELYQATFNPTHLRDALRLNRYVLQNFHDKTRGGFFMTNEGNERVLVRVKELYDGAIPSGTSVQFYNLVRLSRLAGDSTLDEIAEQTGRLYGNTIKTAASGHTMFLAALDFAIGPSVEVVIVGDKADPDTKALLDIAESKYLPRKVLLWKNSDTETDLALLAPYVASQTLRNKRATAYVCTGGSCSSPTNSGEKMLETIMNTAKR